MATDSVRRGGESKDIGSPPLFDRDTWRVLVAAGAEEGTVNLYYYLLDSDTPAEGEWKWATSATMAELASEFGVSEVTLHRRLAQLIDLGAVRRQRHGRAKATFVRTPYALVHSLLERPEVLDTLVRRFPEQYSVGAWEERTREEDLAMQRWTVMQKEKTRQNLFSKIAQRKSGPVAESIEAAKRMTEEKRAYNRSKPNHLRMGRKGEAGLAKEDRAPQLLAYLRRAVQQHLSNFPPPETKENVGKMRYLRDRHGAETVRAVIDWVVQPTNWAQVRRRCGISSAVPTPGVLLGFDTTIFPMALESNRPKRSGGAIDGSVEVDPSLHEL